MSDLDNEKIEATRNLKLNGSDTNVGSIEKAIWRCKELIKPVHINWIGGLNQSAIKIVLGNLEALSDMQSLANKEIEGLRKKVKELEEKNRIFALEGTKVRLELYIKEKINENSNMIREIEEKIIKEEKSGDICEEYLSDLYKERSLIERDIVTLQELLQ